MTGFLASIIFCLADVVGDSPFLGRSVSKPLYHSPYYGQEKTDSAESDEDWAHIQTLVGG